MISDRRWLVSLFVDRDSRRWIVRDAEGEFWTLPEGGDPWSQRERYELSEASSLEPVPGHYLHLLRLPF